MQDFHLHLARFSEPQAIAKGLLAAGTSFNTIACEPWEWDTTLNLLREFDAPPAKEVGFAFGIHPMIAAKICGDDLARLKEILRENPEFHVGECGLDKRFDGYEQGGIQEQIYLEQVKMALDLNRPLQVHCVGDYSRIIKILADVEKSVSMSVPKYVSSSHDSSMIPQEQQHSSDVASVRSSWSEAIRSREHRVQSQQIPQVILHRFGGDVSVVRSALKLPGSRVLFSLHADSFRKKSTLAAIREIPPSQVRFETDADESFAEKFGNSPKEIIRQLEAVQKNYSELQQEIPSL